MNKDKLPKFDGVKVCPKCNTLTEVHFGGGRSAATSYKYDKVNDIMQRQCSICGYEWDERCVDYVEP